MARPGRRTHYLAQRSIDRKEDADEQSSRDRPNGGIRYGFSRRGGIRGVQISRPERAVGASRSAELDPGGKAAVHAGIPGGLRGEPGRHEERRRRQRTLAVLLSAGHADDDESLRSY